MSRQKTHHHPLVSSPWSVVYGFSLMEKKTKATHAFGLYCFLIAIYLSVGGVLQYRFGMGGIAFNEIFLLALPGWLYAYFTGLSFQKTFPLRRPDFKEFLLLLLLTALVIAPIELLVQLQQRFWPLPKSIADFYTQLTHRKVWEDGLIQTVVLAFIPALCEEFFFRGLLMSLMKPYFGPLRSILLTALLFAVAHLNPWYLPYYFLLGCFLGWVRQWKDNLVLCVLAHLANNIYSLYG